MPPLRWAPQTASNWWAQEKMAQKDASGKGLYLGKAMDIIAELNASLNFKEGGEVAANLFRLYNFMTAHLTRANLNWDQEAVEEVLALLSQLKEAWEEVCRKAKTGELKETEETPTAPPRQHLGSLVPKIQTPPRHGALRTYYRSKKRIHLVTLTKAKGLDAWAPAGLRITQKSIRLRLRVINGV